MADVFLSYSSKDRAAAERVQAALTRAGVDVFWDQETPPGVDWDTWIREKLASCKAAVVLWSQESIKSPNVRHEAIVARDAGKLVPAMIETLQASDFPMGLYLVQAVNLQDWRSASSGGMARLVAEVEARLGRGAGSGHAPPKGAGKIKSVKEPGLPAGPMLAGLALVAVIGVGALWMWSQGIPGKPNKSGSAPVEAAAATPAAPGPECLDGSTPDAQGLCANGNRPIPPARALGAPQGTFSERMLGHWQWNDKQACKDGTNVTKVGGTLVFMSPGTRFVHTIESETALETKTTVLEPADHRGEKYVLVPEFNGTSALRSFNLVVRNITTNEVDTWSPCEL